MQRTSHDPRVAALYASTRLPGHVVDVIALTADAGLLATLRAASSPEHSIWHAPSADVAVDLLVGGRCGVLIADLEILRGDHSLLEQLQNQFPELVLLGTGRREEEQRVAALVTSGRIYRFLHKPVSPARASLFLGTATRRYNELRNLEPVAASDTATRSQQAGWLKLALITLAVIATLFGVWIAQRQPSNDEHVPPEARSDVTNKEQQLADLLGHAQMAYAADRLSEPRGNNALQYFRAALALDPRSADAHTGIERVLRTLEGRVTDALAAHDAKRGAVALTTLQRAAPDHPRLESLQSQLVAISRSRPAEASAPAMQQRTATSPEAEVAPLATP